MAPLNSASLAKDVIAASVDTGLKIEEIDLTNCDREPIHIPSFIQPHGYLLAFRSQGWTIDQFSLNLAEFLDQSQDALLGIPLDSAFDTPSFEALRQAVAQSETAVPDPIQLQFQSGLDASGQIFRGIVHLQDDLVILELEPSSDRRELDFFQFSQTIKSPIERLQRTHSMEDLCNVAVQEIRRLVQFDRVMIYQFHPDGSGSVIAEAASEDAEPYLGLRYPATDIPKQAKQLYTLNWLRMIPTIDYEPIPLVPALNPQTQAPLDMSATVLRSVSPMHIDYLRNMGVHASMSISLLRDRKLWGLIACHHNQPKSLNFAQRTCCEFLGQMMSSELGAKEQRAALEHRLGQQSILKTLGDLMSSSEHLLDGLTQSPALLMDLVKAQGVAYIEQDHIALMGKTPTEAQTRALLPYLDTKLQQESIYCTHQLSQLIPESESYRSSACGLLALSISQSQNIFLLWFRPELVQLVNWAGNPQKPEEYDEQGQPYLTPRQSFEQWVETVYLQSEPWTEVEVEAALELRSAVIGLVLQKADELAQLNDELSRSNDELAAFAYVTSHDLKAPLRAIANLACWLQEDLEGQIPEENQQQLDLLQSRVYRMDEMINGLLQYSRVDNQSDASERVLIPALLKEILDSLSPPESIDVQIPTQSLTIVTNKTLLKQVLTNLLSNAVKYINREDGKIEVTVQRFETTLEFQVKDNGPGIEPQYHEKIFQMFQTLQSRDEIESTGIGLAIVKKVVQNQGGQVTLSSDLGQGCTFSFTWPYAPELTP